MILLRSSLILCALLLLSAAASANEIYVTIEWTEFDVTSQPKLIAEITPELSKIQELDAHRTIMAKVNATGNSVRRYKVETPIRVGSSVDVKCQSPDSDFSLQLDARSTKDYVVIRVRPSVVRLADDRRENSSDLEFAVTSKVTNVTFCLGIQDRVEDAIESPKRQSIIRFCSVNCVSSLPNKSR